MKKLLVLIFMLCGFSLLAVDYADGTYYVEADKTTWGWRPFTEITIKNGQISKIVFDRKNKKGKLASEDASYNKSMKKKEGTNPEEYSVVIPQNYSDAGNDLEKMDGLAGATDSVREFKIMMSFLLEKAAKGDTGEFQIKKSDLK